MIMKASELVQALEEGKRLQKDYKLAYPDQYKYSEEGDFVEELFLEHGTARCYGWSSALGFPDERLKEIILTPNLWRIKP